MLIQQPIQSRKVGEIINMNMPTELKSMRVRLPLTSRYKHSGPNMNLASGSPPSVHLTRHNDVVPSLSNRPQYAWSSSLILATMHLNSRILHACRHVCKPNAALIRTRGYTITRPPLNKPPLSLSSTSGPPPGPLASRLSVTFARSATTCTVSPTFFASVSQCP